MNYTYLDQQSEFDQLCETLLAEEQLAVDTEFVRRSTYYPILALLQIATRDEIYLIDPQGIEDWSGMLKLFRSNICVIMHSCSEDLEVFRRFFGELPGSLFDTQIAAAYLGKGDALGYAPLVLLMCGIEVDKSETQSDWSQRPLSDAQLNYAAEDVRWLQGIADELRSELASSDRTDWVNEELDILASKYVTELDSSQAWLKLKGLGKLKPNSWPLAKALCQWREDTARRRDKPKSWIVKDAELLELIQRRPKNNAELSRLPSLSPPLIRHNGKKILEIIQASDALPMPEEAPMPDLTGSERKLLKEMQAVVLQYAEQHSLAQRFIANKQELSQYILFHQNRSSNRSILDQGWRKDMLSQKLQALF